MLSGVLKCISYKLGWNICKIFAFPLPIITSGWTNARFQRCLSFLYVSFEDVDIAASIQHTLICHPLVIFKYLIISVTVMEIRRNVRRDVSGYVTERPYVRRMS